MSRYTLYAQNQRDRTDVHINCAQAVLAAFAPALGLSEETAAKVAALFGSGMKIGSVCGAYTGGLMVLGLAGLKDADTAAEYTEAFRKLEEGRLDCAELLRANTERGGEKKPFCNRLITDSVAILEELLRRRGVIE